MSSNGLKTVPKHALICRGIRPKRTELFPAVFFENEFVMDVEIRCEIVISFSTNTAGSSSVLFGLMFLHIRACFGTVFSPFEDNSEKFDRSFLSVQRDKS